MLKPLLFSKEVSVRSLFLQVFCESIFMDFKNHCLISLTDEQIELALIFQSSCDFLLYQLQLNLCFQNRQLLPSIW